MRNTAMKELRGKLLDKIQELKEPSQTSEYIKAYRQGLIDIANDIDFEMVRFERQIIVDAYNADLYGGFSGQKKFNDGDDYYDSIFVD